VILVSLAIASLMAVESGRYRLLSVSQTTKLILISKIPDKVRYILDASAAKITMNDKPAELSELQNFSLVTVKFELKKSNKNGIEIDGVAIEIKAVVPK